MFGPYFYCQSTSGMFVCNWRKAWQVTPLSEPLNSESIERSPSSPQVLHVYHYSDYRPLPQPASQFEGSWSKINRSHVIYLKSHRQLTKSTSRTLTYEASRWHNSEDQTHRAGARTTSFLRIELEEWTHPQYPNRLSFQNAETSESLLLSLIFRNMKSQ